MIMLRFFQFLYAFRPNQALSTVMFGVLLLLLMAEELSFYYNQILLVNGFSCSCLDGINERSEVFHAEGLGLFVNPRLELHVFGGTLARWVWAMIVISAVCSSLGDFLCLESLLVLVKLRLMSSRGREGSSGSSWNMS
jgi:hypothetical protein